MSYSSTPQGKDQQLWIIAKKRAAFKSHLITYVIVNIGLWVMWYLTGANTDNRSAIPWPAWTSFGWGIGLAFHYAGAYLRNGSNSVEKEYDKLKQKQSQ